MALSAAKDCEKRFVEKKDWRARAATRCMTRGGEFRCATSDRAMARRWRHCRGRWPSQEAVGRRISGVGRRSRALALSAVSGVCNVRNSSETSSGLFCLAVRGTAAGTSAPVYISSSFIDSPWPCVSLCLEQPSKGRITYNRLGVERQKRRERDRERERTEAAVVGTSCAHARLTSLPFHRYTTNEHTSDCRRWRSKTDRKVRDVGRIDGESTDGGGAFKGNIYP